MQKLELKDIIGYIPYGLMQYNKSGIYTPVLLGVYSFGQKHTVCMGENIVPILRPMSDLSKTIVYEDKEEIPIVELAKISTPKRDYNKYDWKFKDGVAVKGRSEFWFNFELSCFYHSGFLSANNYDKLFDYLHSRMFDYRGLIDKGLAVDINTI